MQPKSSLIKLIFLYFSLSNLLSVSVSSDQNYAPIITPLNFLDNEHDLQTSSEHFVAEGINCIEDDEDEIIKTKFYMKKSIIHDRNKVLFSLSGGARSRHDDDSENVDDNDVASNADGDEDETDDDDDDEEENEEENETSSGDDDNKDSNVEDTDSVNSNEENDDIEETYNDNDQDDDEEEPIVKKKSKKYPKKQSKKRKPSMLEGGVGSLASAATAAFKLTKGGVKTAVDLVSSKHVTMTQIAGKWRMEQEVELRKGAIVTCPATIEFTEQGQVITAFEGKLFTSEYKFTERPWPRKCTIQFEATAFQGPNDKEPVSMFYKGYFKRSIMNPKVVLIRGRVYKLLGKLFWKQQKKCGKFKATQRRYR
mmetsp:Transcript_16870/g.16222  ORF Transcript_16870/g.16222 Transcript_16870/m.16222 type:complete len:367 (+) Transcript_16870:273-1373(+)